MFKLFTAHTHRSTHNLTTHHTHTHASTMRCNLIKDSLRFVEETYKISIESQPDIWLGSRPDRSNPTSFLWVCVCKFMLNAIFMGMSVVYGIFSWQLICTVCLHFFFVCMFLCIYAHTYVIMWMWWILVTCMLPTCAQRVYYPLWHCWGCMALYIHLYLYVFGMSVFMHA